VRADLPQPVRAKLPTIHYGWIILGAGAFGSFMTLPGQTAGVSVFFDPITTELGISRTTASIAYAAGRLQEFYRRRRSAAGSTGSDHGTPPPSSPLDLLWPARSWRAFNPRSCC